MIQLRLPRFPSAFVTTMALLLFVCLSACGGGSGLPAEPPAPVDFGLRSSTEPSSIVHRFVNPFSAQATVTAGLPDGPFFVPPSALPVSVGPNGTVDLPVFFAPTGPGQFEDAVRLQFDDGSGVQIQDVVFRGAAEAVTVTVSRNPIVFGQVAPNTLATRDVTVQNTSTVSALTLSTATLPNARLSVVASPFPLTLAPGEPITLTIEYAPLDAADDGGTLVLGAADRGGPVNISISAGTAGPGSEEITDFGAQAVDANGQTQQLTIDVPADAISLTLEGMGTATDQMGLGELIGPNDRVYENTQLTGSYIWIPGTEAFATTVPNTDRAALQLDGAGTYRFRIIRLSGSSATINVRAIIERRSAGFTDVAVLPLNVWLANGLSVNAASAPTDTDLQNTLARIDTIMSGQGIRLGDISYYDVTDPNFDDVTSNQEFGQLLRLTSAATEDRLNLFFVNVALGGTVVGVSATIAGPKSRGTPVSGVMSIYSSSSDFVGLVAAHEIGHFCGLFHTVEQAGGHDRIDDTAECPATGSDATCPTAGGGYLMHWQAVGASALTNGQGLVLRAHPLMAPGTVGGSNKPQSAKRLPRPPLDPAQAAALREAFRRLGDGWCGTCDGVVGPKASE